MTGLELLEGLSFVDARYIAEADTAKLGRNVPWMKVLSVAACLCILIVGAFALENFGHKGTMEEAAAPAAPAATQAAAPLAPAEGEIPESAEEPSLTDELQEVSYAKLQVTRLGEDGWFEAVVEEADTDLLAAGDQICLVVDPGMVPGAGSEITNELSWIAEGAVLMIQNGAYDAGNGVLYVAEVFAETGE